MYSSASSSSASSATTTTLVLRSPVQLEAPVKPVVKGQCTDPAFVKTLEMMAKSGDEDLAVLAKKKLAGVGDLKAEHKKKEAQARDMLTVAIAMEKAQRIMEETKEKVKQIMEESQKKYGEWEDEFFAEFKEYAPKRLDYDASVRAERKRKADEKDATPAKSAKKAKTDSTISPPKMMMPKPKEAAAAKVIEIPDELNTPPLASPTDADKTEMAESYLAAPGGANPATLEGALRSAVGERRKRINGDGSKEDEQEGQPADGASADANAL